jgi:hypothetical protein
MNLDCKTVSQLGIFYKNIKLSYILILRFESKKLKNEIKLFNHQINYLWKFKSSDLHCYSTLSR